METTILATQIPITFGETAPSPPLSLPSGRSVVLNVADGREQLEVRSPSGDVEVRIALTDNGAVVMVRSGRLEMESTDTIALSCRRFELATAEGTTLSSAGDTLITGQAMRVKTDGDIHMNGGIIHLNC